jgi:regulator of sirC expression with transglutaminase-like and TPR domain
MAPGDRTAALLRRLGESPAERIDLAEGALLLASVSHSGVSLSRYRDHIGLLAADLSRAAAAAESLDQRVAVLNKVMFDAYGYAGDHQTYDDLQNANLMRVIDRRRGLPVALGILMIAAARAQGWEIAGLRFPGHFLLRMDYHGQRAILDPFERGRPLSAADLRGLLRSLEGDNAELAPAHYEDADNREILVRLQNNVRLRQAQNGDHLAAASTLETMLLIAPEEKTLWRDKALLAAQLGRIDGAVEALQEYIALETLDGPRHDAAMLLQKLRGQDA